MRHHTTQWRYNPPCSRASRFHAVVRKPYSFSSFLWNVVGYHSSSYHLLSLLGREPISIRVCTPWTTLEDLPWCFRSRITLVVAGPTSSRFATLVTKIVLSGNNTLTLLFSARTPPSPEGTEEDPSICCDPGYVRARTTGSAVCMEKYIGKIACWRDEN